MGMTIDDCIDYFNRSFAIGNTDDAQQHNEVLEMTIEIMQKYQQIGQIIDDWNNGKFSDAVGCLRVKVVVEDGKA